MSLSFQDAGQAGIVDASMNESPPLTVEAELELRVRYAGSGQWSESPSRLSSPASMLQQQQPGSSWSDINHSDQYEYEHGYDGLFAA